MSVKVTLEKAKLRHLITNTGADIERFVADGVEYGIH